MPQPGLKAQAEAIAKKAAAGPVDSSGLTVEPPPLARHVQEALRDNPDLAPFPLQVEQVDSVIRLAGQVTSAALKEQAEETAGEVTGVDLVDSRELRVVPPALGQAAQQKLAAAPELVGQNITVEQFGQNLLLKGSVSEAGLKAVAERLAGEVAGVELVDSRALAVVLPPLTEAVQQALRADARTAGWKIEVEQLQQGILLKGIVPDAETKRLFENVARQVSGVAWVDPVGIQIEPAQVEYVVQVGDSLASIAQKFYGNESRWPAIYEANREAVNRPGRLQIGTRLIIP